MLQLLDFFAELNDPTRASPDLYEKLQSRPQLVMVLLLKSLLQIFSMRYSHDDVYKQNIDRFKSQLEIIINNRYQYEFRPLLIDNIQSVIESDDKKIILPDSIPANAKPTSYLETVGSALYTPVSLVTRLFSFTARLFETEAPVDNNAPEHQEPARYNQDGPV